MVEFGEEIEDTVVAENNFKESGTNLEKASANVITIGEAVKAASVTDKYTEISVEAEGPPEGSSGTSEVFSKQILMILNTWMQKQVLILD